MGSGKIGASICRGLVCFGVGRTFIHLVDYTMCHVWRYSLCELWMQALYLEGGGEANEVESSESATTAHFESQLQKSSQP